MIAEAQLSSCQRSVPQTALKHSTIDNILFDILFLSSESASLQEVHSDAFLFAHECALHVNWLSLGLPDLFTLTGTVFLSVFPISVGYDVAQSKLIILGQFVVKFSAFPDHSSVLVWRFLLSIVKSVLITWDFNQCAQIVMAFTFYPCGSWDSGCTKFTL